MGFDLGKVELALLDDNTDAHEVFTAATATRLPPATPEDLKEALQLLHFTSGADRGMVVQKYAEFFADVASKADELCFDNQDPDSPGWGDPEIRQLSGALPAFTMCTTLSLSNHSVSAEGLRLIAEALPRMPQLEKLLLVGPFTSFDAGDIKFLQLQIEVSCPRLKLLWLPKRLEETAAGKTLSAAALAKGFNV